MNKLLDLMPRPFNSSYLVEEVTSAEQIMFDKLEADKEDVLKQFFVDTATWGLKTWEEIFGIPVDEGKPYSQRRSLLKSKMRGFGTVTVSLIKQVAESFANGSVDVKVTPREYKIEIVFTSQYGRPENQEDIEQALRDIIPAHLGIYYKFKFLTWGEVHQRNTTWAMLQGKTWNDFMTGNY